MDDDETTQGDHDLDRALRSEALNAAICLSRAVTPDEVVEAANVYLAFLKGN